MKHDEKIREVFLDFIKKEGEWCETNDIYRCTPKFKMKHPEQYYEFMMNQLYPKTHKEVFFEMCPNAPKDEDGYPEYINPCHLGWVKRLKEDTCPHPKLCCDECWDRPHKEEK